MLTSLPIYMYAVQAINMRYGSLATLAFGLAVLFRLYQEVWSNAVVSRGRLHACMSVLRL